jgi:hypothetical protein
LEGSVAVRRLSRTGYLEFFGDGTNLAGVQNAIPKNERTRSRRAIRAGCGQTFPDRQLAHCAKPPSRHGPKPLHTESMIFSNCLKVFQL